MTSTENVQKGLVRLLEKLTGVTVIRHHPNEKRPDRPYVMIAPAGVGETTENPQNVEYEDTAELNSQGRPQVAATSIIELDWTFQVYSYGDNPEDRLVPILSAVHHPQVQEPLFPDHLIYEVNPIVRTDELINETWEGRAIMSLSIRGVEGNAQPVDVVTEVENIQLGRI